MTKDIHLIDQDALRTARTMMQQKFYKIMHYYFEDTEAYIHSIEDGLEARDASLVIPAAHTIKSSSKQIGADYVSRIAMEIETLGKNILQGNDAWQDIAGKASELKRIYLLSKQQLELSLKSMS